MDRDAGCERGLEIEVTSDVDDMAVALIHRASRSAAERTAALLSA
jgi:hypothetical protein